MRFRYRVLLQTSLILLLLPPLLLLGAPKSGIEVPESSFSFGMVPYGSIACHTFWLKNVSDTTVHIAKVSPGCACTTIPIREEAIAAGDSLPVVVKLNTEKIPPRPFRKRSRITTTDSNAETAVFLFTGGCFDPEYASLPLRMEPSEARFSINDGDSLATITVTNQTEEEFNLRLLSQPLEPLVEIELPNRQLLPGRSETITVRLNPEYGKLPFDDSFTIYLTDRPRTRFTLPIVLQEIEKK